MDVLSSIPGLAGYLAMQNQRQRQALGDLQGVQGLANFLRQQEEAQRAAEMAPLQRQMMQAQVQAAQQQAARSAREAQFYSPENMQRFMTPGQPAVAPGQGATGGMDDGSLGQILGTGPTEQGAPAAQPGRPTRLDIERLVDAQVAAGLAKPETVMNMRAQQEARLAAIEQRAQQAEMMHQARMAQAATAAERAAEVARHNQFKEALLAQGAALRAAVSGVSGGGSGDARREPFKFSVNGQNVQGWRDRVGNVYGPDGRAIANYGPEITSADQSAEQRRVSEQETLASVNDMLSRVERITASNPGTVAGIGAPVANAATWVFNQLGGAATGNARISPNDRAQQLRDSVLTSLGNLGRLSNQDRQRIEGIWGVGVLGSPAKINEAVNLTRQIIGARYAGSQVPTARGTPQSGSSSPSDDEALVRKYLGGQ